LSISRKTFMKKTSKTEILIATWAGRSGPGYWGDSDHSSHDQQSTSFWLSLRGVVPGDPYSYMQSSCRAISDLGLYVWLDIDGTVSIDLRLHDAGSLSLAEGEQRIKLLRHLHLKGKAYPFNGFERGAAVHAELSRALDALGIRRALVYHGVDKAETYEAVGVALQRIADSLQERLARMKRRCTA
jgi:hypothetical protein